MPASRRLSWRHLAATVLNFLQLCVFLYEFLNTEARKLYRNLRGIALSLAVEHSPFAVFRVFDSLSHAESGLAFFHRCSTWNNWRCELLATRCEEFSDVVDRVIRRSRIAFAFRRGATAATRSARALVFILVTIVALAIVVGLRCRAGAFAACASS